MTALMIANTQIRCDADGRYCLNDLHQASGGEARKRPNYWVDLQSTKELIQQVLSEIPAGPAGIPAGPPVTVVNDGYANGTYAVKELVYAYAMWISAAFHLHVIRAYDALVAQARAETHPMLLAMPQHRADQLVSAGRIFSAALRTARQLRMSPQRAMLAAFACAQRHTGIDWEDELGAQDVVETAALADPFTSRVAAWIADKDRVSGTEIAVGAHLGSPDDRALLMRIAVVMRELGWVKRRPRIAGSQSGKWMYCRINTG